jgi:hypothetical protein
VYRLIDTELQWMPLDLRINRTLSIHVSKGLTSVLPILIAEK